VAARYGVPEDHVLPTQGTSLGIFLAMAASLERGDEVLVERPAYEPLFKVPLSLGLHVRRFDRPFEEGYAVDVDRVRRELTPRTRMIVVSDLHNPTGRTLSPETRTALVELAAEKGATLFVDEVYRDFLPGPPATAYRPGMPVIVASSLTKVYGMGGLRAGWVLADPKVVVNGIRVQDFLHVNDPYPMVPFIAAAFDRADALLETARRVSSEGRQVLEEWVAGRADIAWAPPHGGLTAFPRLPAGISGTGLSEALRRDEATLVVPGRFFEDDRHVRIGVGQGTDVLREGLVRLGRTLDRLRV
jgi:aspartate/methionine/tyrosine aminotransferase